MGDPTDTAIPRLITSFHPSLNARSVRSVSELQPESEYGPGSVEYEVTADFLRLSIPSITNTSIFNEIREQNPEKNVRPSSSRITFLENRESRASLRPLSTNTLNFDGKGRPGSFGGGGYSDTSFSPRTSKMVSSTLIPEEVEKEISVEDLTTQINVELTEPNNSCFEHQRVPRGSLYFLFGFLFMPIWWYGAIFPKNPRDKTAFRWRSFNRMMSLISIIIMAVGLGMLIWFLV